MPQSKAENPNPRISLDQVKEVIATSGQRADDLRAKGFEVLVNVKRAKLVRTRRERTRLAERHGEKDPRVARLDRQLTVEHGLLVNSRAEHARIQTPSLERKAAVWQLHGHVRDPDGLPRNRYTVGLYPDAEGIGQPVTTAITNAAGYFHLTWEPPAVRQPPTPVPPAAGATPQSAGATKPSAAETLAVALKVSRISLDVS